MVTSTFTPSLLVKDFLFCLLVLVATSGQCECPCFGILKCTGPAMPTNTWQLGFISLPLGRRNTFAIFHKMRCSVRGRRITLDVSIAWSHVFFANRIGRAASSGDKVQIPWQAWHFVKCDENWRKPRTKHRFWGNKFSSSKENSWENTNFDTTKCQNWRTKKNEFVRCAAISSWFELVAFFAYHHHAALIFGMF